jgi:hypothetical protein
MGYRINKTDGTLLIDLIDGTIDTESSDITLIGRNFKGFGELINENFVKMLENFASSSAPANPLRGQLWYDTAENRLKVYNGTAFATNGIIVSSTQPNLATGDIWLNSLTNQMSFFDGTDLVMVGPTYTAAQGVTGFVAQTVLSNLNQNKTVLKLLVGNVLIGVWSASQFTPVSSQLITELVTALNPTGVIYQGFNTTNSAYKYLGVASLAEGLIDGSTTILASQFLRSDVADTTSGTLKISSLGSALIAQPAAFTVGTNNQLEFRFNNNQDLFINNNIAAKNITIQTTNTTSLVPAIAIQGGSATPQITLGGPLVVNGTLTVAGSIISTGLTAINTVTLTVDDKNIELGSVDQVGLTGNITTASTISTITGMSSTTGLLVGQTVTKTAGTGVFGTGTTITSIDSATQITVTGSTAHTVGSITFDCGASDVTADGGGITIKGTTDKTFNWIDATDSWTSSEHIDLAAGKSYKIGTTTVLSTTALGSTILSSSLTSVGSLGILNVDNLQLDGITLRTTAVGDLQLESFTNIISIQGVNPRITGLGLPTDATDATRKDYVDGYAPITITLDITGLNITGQLNTNIITILTDIYPPAGLPAAGGFIGIPASAPGRVATVYTLESSALNYNIPGANLNSSLILGTAQVDQTLSGVSVLATAVQTLAGVGVAVNLDPGHIRITTASGHSLEIGHTVSISGSAGISFNGTYTVAKVTSPTAFDIDVSALIPGIDSVSGGTYTPNSATVLRAATIGNFNKLVLQDVSFSTVAVSTSGTVTRGLKRFKVQGGVWVFHADDPLGVIV